MYYLGQFTSLCAIPKSESEYPHIHICNFSNMFYFKWIKRE